MIGLLALLLLVFILLAPLFFQRGATCEWEGPSLDDARGYDARQLPEGFVPEEAFQPTPPRLMAACDFAQSAGVVQPGDLPALAPTLRYVWVQPQVETIKVRRRREIAYTYGVSETTGWRGLYNALLFPAFAHDVTRIRLDYDEVPRFDLWMRENPASPQMRSAT